MRNFFFKSAAITAAMSAATTANSATSDQFDLVCVSATHPHVRYRIDLQRNEACSDDCERVWSMGRSTSGELALLDKRPAYRGDLEERIIINKASGELQYYMSLSGRSDTWLGRCEQAPFTGFPAAKF